MKLIFVLVILFSINAFGVNSMFKQINPGITVGNISSDPSGHRSGDFYFNTTDHTFHFYNGSNWWYSLGVSSIPAGGIVYGSSTTNVSMLAAGTLGQILTSGGSGSPSWVPAYWSGTNNSVIGTGGFPSLSSGHDNMAFGFGTATGITSGSNNVFMGSSSGGSMSSGSRNTCIGHNSCGNMSTNSDNTMIGDTAGQGISGSRNVTIGASSGSQSGSTNSDNVTVGYGSFNTVGNSGKQNVGLGSQTGNSITSGTDNVFLGFQSGFTCGSSSTKNIFIGSTSDCSSSSAFNNQILIGYGVTSGTTNSAVLGASTNFWGISGATPGSAAVMTFPANSTSLAPIKLQSGSLMSSIAAGSIEYDGNYYYGSISGNIRDTILATPDSFTTNGVLYTTSTTPRMVPAGTAGQILVSGGASAPTWAATNPVTGGIVYTSGTSASNFAVLPAGTSGQVLQSTGAGAPSWAPNGSFTAPRSQIQYVTGAGHGSTNTNIRRIETSQISTGSDISITNSAANGTSLTINTTGVYCISYWDTKTSNGGFFGLSKNSAQLTTSIASITQANRLIWCESSAANFIGNCTWCGILNATDVVRPHDDNTMDDTTAGKVGISATLISY